MSTEDSVVGVFTQRLKPEKDLDISSPCLAYRCQHDTAATGRGSGRRGTDGSPLLFLIRYVGHCANRHTHTTVGRGPNAWSWLA